jgi:hypothetical protein
MINESAVSFNWLKQQTGLDDQVPSQTVQAWNKIVVQMRSVSQTIISTQQWVSDCWICKDSKFETNVAPRWSLPDKIDEWPSGNVLLAQTQPTNHGSFLKLLSSHESGLPDDSDNAVQRFYALDDGTQGRGDVAMCQAEYVRAWLFIALGPLLMSIALSP